MAALVAVAVVAIAAVAFLGGQAPGATSTPDATHTLQGTATVPPDSMLGPLGTLGGLGGGCDPEPGYGVVEGANIVILDDKDAIIGSTSLGGGIVTKMYEDSQQRGWCTLSFTVTVPDRPFYTARIGERRGPTYSRDQLASGEWRMDLTLGIQQ